jgi:hypothetical protein
MGLKLVIIHLFFLHTYSNTLTVCDDRIYLIHPFNKYCNCFMGVTVDGSAEGYKCKIRQDAARSGVVRCNVLDLC